MPTQTSPDRHLSAGGRLVTADNRTLPLRATHLAVTAGGGLARTRLVQRFQNPHAEPLAVTYLLPLPADGAVAGFAFTIGARRVVGEIDRRAQARARFETALAEGRTTALLEQDRAALFHQEIGNIPPGAEVVAEVLVDQPLAWAGGAWEFRFPTAVAPRYLGAADRVADAERITVDVADQPLAGRLTLDLRVDDRLAPGATPTSPAHALRAEVEDAGARITLAAETPVRLDRDVVVRWPIAGLSVGATLATARPPAGPQAGSTSDCAFGLLTLVPPAILPRTVARDLIVLLDISGSMAGEPIAQAKAVVAALVDSLEDTDQLELIAFASAPQAWQRRSVRADAKHKRAAHAWLAALQAGGGTEMREALRTALQPLRPGSQRQVLLVSDGHIGFEHEIVADLLRELPAGCRLHTLGVGSAPNRTLTCAGARAGRGVEVLVGLGEDPADATRRLRAALAQPVVVDLEISGAALDGDAPTRVPDLFAGAATRLSLRLRPDGGSLHVRGRSADGEFAHTLAVAPTPPNTGRPEIVTRYGREHVEDLEMQLGAGGDGAPVDARIEAVGLQFGLATRLTSWIAVATEPGVDPTAPTRREMIPHELAHGMSVVGLGLRPAHGATLDLILRSCAPVAQMQEPAAASVTETRLPSPTRARRMSKQPAPTDRVAVLVRRVARREAGEELSFEIMANGDAWNPPLTVTLRWADGTECVASLIATSSTRPGVIAAGVILRLSVASTSVVPQVAPATLEVHGATFHVRAART